MHRPHAAEPMAQRTDEEWAMGTAAAVICPPEIVHVIYYTRTKKGVAILSEVRRQYTGEFKEKVVKDIEENGLSLRNAAKKYGISKHSVVQQWYNLYKREGAAVFYLTPQEKAAKKPRKPKPPVKDHKDLLAENEYLRMENAYLKKLKALIQERDSKES